MALGTKGDGLVEIGGIVVFAIGSFVGTILLGIGLIGGGEILPFVDLTGDDSVEEISCTTRASFMGGSLVDELAL